MAEVELRQGVAAGTGFVGAGTGLGAGTGFGFGATDLGSTVLITTVLTTLRTTTGDTYLDSSEDHSK
jgi:hypothetical protein